MTAQTTFQRTYGGEGYDKAWSAAQTADGGYVIIGCTDSFGARDDDVWLIKTDASGDTMWTRIFGGPAEDWGYSVTQTADGGYILVSHTRSFGAGEWDVWLIKTDASGDTMWTRTYGGANYDRAYSVAQTADGGYVITGHTKSYGAGGGDVWLIKTGASGDTLWTRTFGGTEDDYGNSVQQTTDGGYGIAGYTGSFGAGCWDVWFIKTDFSGDTMWTRTFGGELWDEGRSVTQTAEGGYVVTGRTRSFGAGGFDVWLIKTDAAGDTIWTRTFGGGADDDGYSVAQTTDGGYVVAGYTWSFAVGCWDVWLIKTDASGDALWTRTYGGMHWDFGRSVQQTTDGGYIIAGYTKSFGAGYADAYLIKTDSAGNAAAIAEPEPPVAHKLAPATIVRAVLHLQSEIYNRESEILLLNSAGRKVMDLRPGPNDIRHLAPGIYFVRHASGIRKVVVQR